MIIIEHLLETNYRVTDPAVQKNVWVEFVGLAMKHNAVNLGQGEVNFYMVRITCL